MRFFERLVYANVAAPDTPYAVAHSSWVRGHISNELRAVSKDPFAEGKYTDPIRKPTASNGASILWDTIASIEYTGYEHVYDIEVEGTHNFIANEIFAHNTYMSGNVGIGTTGPAQKLHVEGQCVTGDTLLAVIARSPDIFNVGATKPFDKSSGLRPERSRRTKQSQKIASLRSVARNDTIAYVPIKDVQPGMMVYSLNEGESKRNK